VSPPQQPAATCTIAVFFWGMRAALPSFHFVLDRRIDTLVPVFRC
jgi:hypothetical protein